MWLDVIIAFSCGFGGLCSGWVMHGLHKNASSDVTARGHDDSPSDSDNEPSTGEPSREQLSEVAGKLRNYAASMAADVDAHQSRVQAVNDSLQEQDSVAAPADILASVNDLIRANEVMQQQLHSAQDRIQEQTLKLETAEKQAQTDALTRVANRRAFDGYLDECHRRGPERTGALAILDVDHFKQFNDVYGHRAGDEVLRVVAGVLNARLQQDGLVARFGGEEFAVLLNPQDQQETLQRIEQARQAICSREIPFEGQCLRVTACIGVAFLRTGESKEQWLQRADDALYRCKDRGRDNAHWMDGDTPRKITPWNDATPAIAGAAEPATKTPTDKNSADHSVADETSEGIVKGHDELRGDTPPERSPATDAKDTVASKKTARNKSTSTEEPPAGHQEPNRDDDETDDPPSRKPAARAFAYLPDRLSLSETFQDLNRRSQAMQLATYVLAIRFNGDPSSFKMRSLLQVVRASSRNVDHIGCEDDCTLLLIMPSADAGAANQRGQQICNAAASLQLGSDDVQDGNPVSVGIAESTTESSFDELADIALGNAVAASENDGEPVRASTLPVASV